MIPPDGFEKDPTAKQYVYLKAAFPGYTIEKVVLVSFQSGYLFIQTDKTLYTPDSIVYFRIFALTPGMKPIGRDETTGNPASITVEIVTPEGIIIPLDPVSLRDGMHSGTYQLGEIVSPGQWKVVSRFQSNPQHTYSAEFEVKQYVLPSYEVKVTSDSAFYYYDTPSFRVEVKATYLFGKEVDGMAYVAFGVMKDGTRKVFPPSLQRIPISKGKGEATLEKDHILKTFTTSPDTEHLVGGSLFVTAMVYTESGSEMVEGELRNIQIVKSPYFINFDKTPKYFKGGMLFDVTVTVTNPDGTPAENIPVVVEPGLNVQGTTQANGRASLTINTGGSDTQLTITARTNDPQLPPERQTRASMVAKPHQTKSNNYIHITVMSSDVKLGSDLKVHLNLNRHTTPLQITYLILSRGQLVGYGRQVADGQLTIALSITVTKLMLPSLRLIVYYHPTPSEVVSDSVWVDVDDSCMGTLKLEQKNPVPSYEPRRTFHLKVTGDPGSTVGLVAVDKGVYVLNKKHLLTQKKIWQIVEKADTGCTPGGGKNSMGVFFDAGLIFETDSQVGTPYRQEVKCSAPARKKRAGTLIDAITTLASAYSDPLEHECCLAGMKTTHLSYTCATRKLYITDGKACEDAFLHCCEELAKQRNDLKQDNLVLARSEEDNSYMDSNEITSRTKFPESWQWVTFKIPQCTGKPNCEINMGIPLKDSITTWVFTGISLSENTGICVGKPLDVVVFKQFFLDLKLPYSAVVGEQIEIRTIIHNYIEDPITVRIELIENPDVCSSASKRGKYSQQVKVGASTTRAVPFIIIPMKEGELNIEVKAAVKDSWHGDGVMKPLRVVPNGVLTKVNKIVNINPGAVGGTQEETINNAIAKTEMVPNTPSSTKVFVSGREQVSPLVENVIGASSMGSLIYQPTGCGEQNMYHMTKPVIATTYLDKTNQWEAVGLQKRTEALGHISTGYRNELKYAKADGSFAVFTHEKKSSTWLTAYVVKVLSMANNLVAIENKHICNAVKFLILRSQMPDGMFTENGRIIHREYTGDVLGRESDASMTAFCLIAMQESRGICEETVNSLPSAIDKSVAYLEKRLPSLTNPYAVTITSYALANENKLNKEILYNFVSPEMTHWKSPQGHVFTLEATAYALLALVKGGFLEEARPIVRWFTNQQKQGGGYGSTQATIMVYQAVSEYWTVAKEPEYNLDVELKVPGRAAPYSFRFTRENHYTTRTSKNFEVNENVKLTAKGTGEGTLTLVTQYYAVPKETVSDCTKFNLTLDFSLEKVDENEGDIYKLRIEFFFKNKEEDASMSILDISLPTGFMPINEDLNALSEGRARVISMWEFNKALSEKGSLILYMNKVAHDRIEELPIRLRQTHKVGVLQPASVSIYEYYDETRCVKYYHPQKKDGRILRRCKGDECLCAEENCSMQKKGKISNQERIAKACESTLTSKIDFVYSVVLEEAVYDVSFDTYIMRIEGVIKDGTYDKNAEGKLRNFLSFSHCRESLNLQKNKGYLIMGAAEDTLQDTSTDSYEYLLGERTWIEYWPRGEECQMDEHRPACLGMEALVDKYESRGCIAK